MSAEQRQGAGDRRRDRTAADRASSGRIRSCFKRRISSARSTNCGSRVGARMRLFARTNARCTDGLRGVIGVIGSVLEVTAIGAEALRLPSASGREGLIAWDTLRDRERRRLQLTYGEALTIDATQGLTSTEHMRAGTRAVDPFKAYTSGSRHRQATFIVVSERKERKEIAGRRPINDPRGRSMGQYGTRPSPAAGEAERARLPLAHRQRSDSDVPNLPRNLGAAREIRNDAPRGLPRVLDELDVYAPYRKATMVKGLSQAILPRPHLHRTSTEHRDRHFAPLKRDCNLAHCVR